MKYKLICFDLQGTLSNAEFSDYFWFETLPALHQKSKNIKTIEESKRILKNLFSGYGKYDPRYYSVQYWIGELGIQITEEPLIESIQKESQFYTDTEVLVHRLIQESAVILLSTTTRSFLTKELGGREHLFTKTYSALDDFETAGKTKELYQKIARMHGVRPEEAINIGDNKEMDIVNAQAAGWGTFFFDKTVDRALLIEQLKKIL